MARYEDEFPNLNSECRTPPTEGSEVSRNSSSNWKLVLKLSSLTVLFTKPLAGGRNDLGDHSPIHGFRVFQELYQAKPGMALLAAL